MATKRGIVETVGMICLITIAVFSVGYVTATFIFGADSTYTAFVFWVGVVASGFAYFLHKHQSKDASETDDYEPQIKWDLSKIPTQENLKRPSDLDDTEEPTSDKSEENRDPDTLGTDGW